MEIAAINALYTLTFNNTIKEFSDKRTEIQLTNQHKKGYVAFNVMSSFLHQYEILLTAYNYQENSGYTTHEAKEAVIKSYLNNKNEYKADPLYYFLSEHLPIIFNRFSERLEALKEQTKDPFALTEEEIINLLAKVDAYHSYKDGFKKEWDEFLAPQYKEEEDASYELNGLERIEWLGKQKELAELFIELKNKGYIKEIKPTLIKAFFTETNTIQQILKPATDPKTKTDTYSEVYTSKYKPRFEKILPPSGSTDKK